MISAFSTALSGLTANASAIDTTSTNLANLNTSGYKKDQVSFQDLVNQTIGSSLYGDQTVTGGTIEKNTRQFIQGTPQTTNGPFDAAIQGDGFFVTRNASGAQLLTRDGGFRVDSTGHLITGSGNFVQGWNAVNGALSTGGPTTDVTLPAGASRAPVASTKFSINLNLNGNGTVGGSDGSFSSPVQVLDSQGGTHLITVNFTKNAPNAWSYTVNIPSSDIQGGSGANTSIATGSLTFDSSGNLNSPLAASGPVQIPVQGLTSGAADMTLNWNLFDTAGKPKITQFAQASSNIGSDHDGSQAAQILNFNIGDAGQIFAHFSNGDTSAVGQLALATVRNMDSLEAISGNSYTVTSKSATPVIGAPGTASRGMIVGGALEGSTVDIAEEFTHLLTFERGYQANSKVITTVDEITQATLALKQ